jgi:TPR repeat protein
MWRHCIFFLLLPALLLVSCRKPDPILEKKITTLEKKALAGDADAQFKLGDMLYKGIDVQHDDLEAFRWFKLAAEQDHPLALNRLGMFYHDGRGGVQKDDKEAVLYFRKAANQGLAEAQYNLAVMLDGTHKIDENLTEMMSLFKSAADQGYAPAQFSLGSLLAISQNDPIEAYFYLQLAAANHQRGTAKCLENLEKKMTADQLATAKRRVQEEKAKGKKP